MSITKKAPEETKTQAKPSNAANSSSNFSSNTLAPSSTSGKTRSRIVVHYDVGFPNNLYIRGKGADLSWDRGILLKNTKADEWVWETDENFATCEFKVLINDYIYESQENHVIKKGQVIEYTPIFPA